MNCAPDLARIASDLLALTEYKALAADVRRMAFGLYGEVRKHAERGISDAARLARIQAERP